MKKFYKVLEVNPHPSYMYDSDEPYEIFKINDYFDLEYKTKGEAEEVIDKYYSSGKYLAKERVFTIIPIYECEK